MSALLFFYATLIIACTCSNSKSDNSLGRGQQIRASQKATAEAVDLSISPAFSRETLFWHYLVFVDTFRKGTPSAVAFKLWVQWHLFFQSSTQCCKAVERHALPLAAWLNFSALREWEKGQKNPQNPCKFSVNVTEVLNNTQSLGDALGFSHTARDVTLRLWRQRSSDTGALPTQLDSIFSSALFLLLQKKITGTLRCQVSFHFQAQAYAPNTFFLAITCPLTRRCLYCAAAACREVFNELETHLPRLGKNSCDN